MNSRSFFGSIAAHLLLGALLLFTPAFLSAPPDRDVGQILEVLPADVLETLLEPEMQATPPPSVPSPSVPDPPAPRLADLPIAHRVPEKVVPKLEPDPEPPKKEVPPVPKKVESPQPKAKPEPKPEPPQPPAPAKPAIKVDLTLRKTTPKAPSKPVPVQNTEAIRAAAKAAENLRERMAGSVSVQAVGVGGSSTGDYAQKVFLAYDRAWIVTDAIRDNGRNVEVTVVVARNGEVIRASVARTSGNPALDASVQKALDRVRFIAPFPPGKTGAQDTFTIHFNLRNKRG